MAGVCSNAGVSSTHYYSSSRALSAPCKKCCSSVAFGFGRQTKGGCLSVVSAALLPVDAGDGPATFAIVSGGAIAALAGAALFTDPQTRREKQAEEAGGSEKESVRTYFNTQGFERWRKIYGETDDVNSVQLDIRLGHAETVEKTLALLKSEEGLQGVTVCDAGCGTGSLTIPMVLEGASVSASDISSSMVEEASRRAQLAVSEKKSGVQITEPQFQAQDLECITGKYHTVVCLDVLIHYPQEKAAAMIQHLASRAEKRLVLSFAPKTLFYSVLKRVGELFPGPSKATRAYLHAEEDVEKALAEAGWVVRRRDMTATKFYFSRLLEAVPAGAV